MRRGPTPIPTSMALGAMYNYVYVVHMRVGTAELRNRLSYFLAKVRRGQRVVVTDRGEPVAEIVPIAAESDLRGRIEALARDGVVTAEPKRPRAMVQALPLHHTDLRISQLVSDLRNGR
jgi:prevent-host-death family protein